MERIMLGELAVLEVFGDNSIGISKYDRNVPLSKLESDTLRKYFNGESARQQPEIIANKVQAIKDLRQYFSDKYGVSFGLKESKDIIESIMAQQETKSQITIPLSVFNELTKSWTHPTMTRVYEIRNQYLKTSTL
jgi:hypothetical protein